VQASQSACPGSIAELGDGYAPTKPPGRTVPHKCTTMFDPLDRALKANRSGSIRVSGLTEGVVRRIGDAGRTIGVHAGGGRTADIHSNTNSKKRSHVRQLDALGYKVALKPSGLTPAGPGAPLTSIFELDQ